MFFAPNLVIGLGIMLLGIVLTLDRLGMAQALDLLKYWPVMLVLFGASVVLQSFRRRTPVFAGSRPNGGGGGFAFLAIFLAAAWLFGNVAGSEADERANLFGLLGESSRTSLAAGVRDANVTSVMGKSTLDLRQAKVSPGEEVVVDVFTLMGKSTVRIPDHWSIDLRAVPVMGAVEDNRWPGPSRGDGTSVAAGGENAAPAEAVEAPRLVLRGFVMMGKIQVVS